MTTIPEEAVKAAKDVLYYANPNDVERALTAAAPHLAAVRVTGDDLVERVARAWASIDGRSDLFDECKFSKFMEDQNGTYEGYMAEARELIKRAALEPSAARELALEEVFRKGLEAACKVIDAHSEYDRQMCCDGRECGCYGATVHQSMQHYIRALSSPDHADAGKVDGDGWRPIESAPKDTEEPYLCYSPGNKRAHNEYARYAHYHIDGFSERWPKGRNQYPEAPYTHWRPLPSAPSEGLK